MCELKEIVLWFDCPAAKVLSEWLYTSLQWLDVWTFIDGHV